MGHWSIKMIACRLFGANPLPKPVMCCSLEPGEYSFKIQHKYTLILFKKISLKISSAKWPIRSGFNVLKMLALYIYMMKLTSSVVFYISGLNPFETEWPIYMSLNKKIVDSDYDSAIVQKQGIIRTNDNVRLVGPTLFIQESKMSFAQYWPLCLDHRVYSWNQTLDMSVRLLIA